MTRRLIPAAALTFALGACGIVPQSPPTPTPAMIQTESQSIAGISAAPMDILTTGVELSNGYCTTYFNKLVNQAAGLNLASQETTLAGGVTSGVMGLTGAGAGATAIAGIAFPAVSASLQNAARTATGGIQPAAVWPMVQKAENAYLSALPANGPTTKTEAVMYVGGYAAQCQPAGIQSLALESQLNANPVASGGGGATPASLRLAPPSAIRPPPVVSVR